MKKLYKSRDNKILCGIIGGLGEYFGVDPVILRLAWVLIVFLSAVVPGIIIYLIACLIVPESPQEK